MSRHPHEPPPRPSDEEVAALPLSSGRAELLEEIMSTPVRDTRRTHATRDTGDRSHRARWLAPLAAAAVVAGLATVPLWTGDGDDGGGTAGRITADPSASAPVSTGAYVILDAPGWTVSSFSLEASGREIVSYSDGARRLNISTVAASSYARFIADEQTIVQPPAPGEPLQVLGVDAQLWSYNAQEHEAVREPEDGVAFVLDATGMDQATFVELLGSLRRSDLSELRASLPDLPADQQSIVDGIAAAIDRDGLVLPPGEDMAIFSYDDTSFLLRETVEEERLADVSGYIACRWVTSYAEALESGDEAGAEEAAAVMATAREWPALQELGDDAPRDKPGEIYAVADDMAAGRGVAGYRGSIGCF